MKIFALLALLLTTAVFAQNPLSYDFLQRFEPPHTWIPEKASGLFGDPPASLKVDLHDFYSEFDGRQEYKIFVGGGAQIFATSWPQDILNMIKASNDTLKLGLQGL